MEAPLVRAARAGSQAAFGRLVERHQQGLRAFLRRAVGPDADDIAQEALVAAWAGLPRLRDDEGFRSWLYGIAWRKALTHIRSAARTARRDHAWQEERDGEGSGLAAEDRLALQAAMATLAPDQRAAVALCLADGWSHGEAADALGLPLGTIKSHVARGRDKLLSVLGDKP
jgi:RNA polymerase sigma-70 factor (ECF subfamily)